MPARRNTIRTRLFSCRLIRSQTSSRGLILALAQFAVFISASSVSVTARVHEKPPADTTICALSKNPRKYAGKVIRIRGRVLAVEGLELTQLSGSCGDNISLNFPEEAGATESDHGLVRDKDFELFESYLSERPEDTQGTPTPLAIPRRKYCNIEATMIGRLHEVTEKDAAEGRGYGNLGYCRFMLVVRSVADPKARLCSSPSKDSPPGGADPSAYGSGRVADP